MNNAKMIIIITVLICTANITAAPSEVAEAKAMFTSTPIKIDGKLDEPVWKKAIPYTATILTPNGKGKLKEKTLVYLAWDKKKLYIAAKCFDSNIVAKGKKDQMHHYKLGDVLEVFLKPIKRDYYWELYSTPTNKKTTFFFTKRRQPAKKIALIDLAVASQCSGTLNQTSDSDTYWTTEMAIDIDKLSANGIEFSPETAWSILIARCNTLATGKSELSCYPALSKFDFHTYEEYARLVLLKK